MMLQEKISELIGVRQNRISEIIGNTNFGEIDNLLSQGHDVDYITTFLNRESVCPDTGEARSLRKSIRRQAEKLAAAIQGKGEYAPFVFRI